MPKGDNTWNKGKKTGIVPHSVFKKGSKPWNFGLKGFLGGEKHYNWKGGISKDSHSLCNREYRFWRISVFERDNWTCQGCGIRGCYLEAHHIKSWAKFKELRYILENGVTLCKDCHSLTDNYKGKGNKK